MRYLCIDYGLERTGLAVSDPSERLVFPYKTLCLSHFKNRKALLDALASEVAATQAQAVIMGLPVPLEGEETLICRQIRKIKERLSHRIAVPILFMNECLSSEEARMDLNECGLGRRKQKAVLDQQAAVRILESFLALQRQKRGE